MTTVSLPQVCGPSWWAALEGVVNAIPCGSCRQHGLSLLSAMHDLVNDELGQPMHNEANFERVAGDYLQSLNQLLERQGHRPKQIGLPVGMAQAKVSISGKCSDGDECTIRIRATEEVKTTVGGAAAIPDAVDQVRRQLEERTSAVGTPFTFALGSNGVTRYEFRYRVIAAAELVASHDPFTFQPNPEYPQELQPRLRDRAATRVQVEKIAANLEPEALLTDFRSLDRGAPIVGPDLVVESGNGRVMALKLAADEFPEEYSGYRSTLVDVAPQFGISAAQVQGMTDPVLVRERVTDVDRRAFAEEANTSAAIGSSAIEQARSDARAITAAMLAGLAVGESQSIEDALRSPSNRAFVGQFLAQLPEQDQARLVDGDGRVNQDGIRRASMAIFVATFQSASAGLKLAEMAFESIDLEVRNVVNALARSLGPLAQAETLVAEGQRDPELTIGDDLAKAATVFAKIKASPGMTVDKYLAQGQLLERELTEFEELVLQTINARSRSAKKMSAVFRAYADAVVAQPPPGQTTLIDLDAVTKEQLWAQAVDRAETGDQPGLFGQDGVMVAFFLEESEAARIALPSGVPKDDLHITLAYLGTVGAMTQKDIDRLPGLVESFAKVQSPMHGTVGGVGRFSTAGEHPFYASVDVPGLESFREALVRHLESNGIAVSHTHGFTPHITLVFLPPHDRSPVHTMEPVPVTLKRVTVAIADERHVFQLKGAMKAGQVDRSFAETILEQLGGQQFIAMTGAKDLVANERGLQFSIPRTNGINKVRITLNSRDLYDVEFWNLRRSATDIRLVDQIDDVPADQLRQVFTDRTGLDTKLFQTAQDVVALEATQQQFDAITKSIRDALARGVVPWRQPWRSGGQAGGLLPFNARSGRTYRGLNVAILAMQGYQDPRWLTLKQANELGGKVRKGEKSTRVYFWKVDLVENPESSGDEDPERPGRDLDGQRLHLRRFVFRMYNVFNVGQVDGLKLKPLPDTDLTPVDPLPAADRIAQGYLARSGVTLQHVAQDRAFYRPSTDVITLPDPRQFEDQTGYYATLFHEMGHSTGHPSRLNRVAPDEPIVFGSPNYSKEELVAEFCAAFLTSEVGLDNIEPNAAYIKSWLQALNDDPGMLVFAAGSGQAAAEHVLGDRVEDVPEGEASKETAPVAQENDEWGSRCRDDENGRFRPREICGPLPEDGTRRVPPPPAGRPLEVELAGNTFRFAPETIEAILATSDQTNKKERGFHVCIPLEDPDKGIVPGQKCLGGKCSVRLKGCIGPNQRVVGFFHTHPNDGYHEETRQQTFSTGDLLLATRPGTIAGVSGSKTDKLVLAAINQEKVEQFRAEGGKLGNVPRRGYPYIHPTAGPELRKFMERRGPRGGNRVFYPELGRLFDYVEIDKEELRGWITQTKGVPTKTQAEAQGQMSLSQCDDQETRKVESCIHQLKGDPTLNPWAVCQASIGCALPRRSRRMNTGGTTLETMSDVEGEIQRALNAETTIKVVP